MAWTFHSLKDSRVTVLSSLSWSVRLWDALEAAEFELEFDVDVEDVEDDERVVI